MSELMGVRGVRRLALACTLFALMPLALTANLARAQQPGVGQTSVAEAAAVEGDTIPEQNLFEIVRQGGKLMIPLLVCSFILVLFTFERAISLRRSRVIPDPFVKRFLHQLEEGALDQEQALELCEENRSPVAQVFAGAVRKWGKSSVEVEQAILDAGERVSNTLRRYLRVLNGVATVAPLLGLLGTVVGMITAFNAIAGNQALGRPELLAGGISQALLTTAAGMTVAIPALIAYLYFVSCVDRRIMEIDSLGQELVSLISADGKPQSSSKGSRTRKREQAA